MLLYLGLFRTGDQTQGLEHARQAFIIKSQVLPCVGSCIVFLSVEFGCFGIEGGDSSLLWPKWFVFSINPAATRHWTTFLYNLSHKDFPPHWIHSDIPVTEACVVLNLGSGSLFKSSWGAFISTLELFFCYFDTHAHAWGPGWLQTHSVAKTSFQLLCSGFLGCFFTKHWLPVWVCTTMFPYPLVLLSSFLSGMTKTSGLIFSISYLRAGNCYFPQNL